jgi:hypothetical protein
MHSGRPVFAQLMELVPLHRFRQLVEIYQADKRIRTLSAWTQFQALIFAQLTSRASLRSIEVGLASYGHALYHMGFRHPVARSTLAEANERRDYHLWQDLCYELIARTRPLYAGDQVLPDLEGSLYALDCTVVDLCLKLFAWAQHRKHKSAVRIHTLLDLAGAIPTFVEVTPGHQHEVAILDQIVFEPGAYLVMDKGYTDFARLYRLSLVPVYFVIRAKRGLAYKRGVSQPVDKTTGLRSDMSIRLIGPKTAGLYPQPLRRVHYGDPDTGKDLVFLTNNFQLPALTITQLYRERWAVELFFKWIKQHLHIQAFYGTSPNAVKTQVYTGIAAYLLVAQVKKLLRQTHSPYILLQMIGLHLDEKVPLEQLLTRLNFQLDDCPVSNQLVLFD